MGESNEPSSVDETVACYCNLSLYSLFVDGGRGSYHIFPPMDCMMYSVPTRDIRNSWLNTAVSASHWATHRRAYILIRVRSAYYIINRALLSSLCKTQHTNIE